MTPSLALYHNIALNPATERVKVAYTDINFKTKKALKEAIASGKDITVYQPGPFGPAVNANGSVTLEGPHYPEPHKWYAQGTMRDGLLVSVK